MELPLFTAYEVKGNHLIRGKDLIYHDLTTANHEITRVQH